MPKDVHWHLHKMYQPPKFPTKEQALARVRAAYESGEKLKVYDVEARAYIMYGLTSGLMQDIEDEYRYLRNTKNDIKETRKPDLSRGCNVIEYLPALN